ncbi:phosphoglycerate kinase [Lactococcus fujiensis]|uniref:Phosphoglycerate kinase n=1 Tax=Lactococcus fujiensis JCM 16395 TaxID=1291764 RepID=A0A2A5RKZ3_9LACT|nr:phosphoglycerate kinase [Lactococcus fujiensis]PCR99871.1 phosphoglycerate kinase [Lactococcus fujiensis JCM 16395]
MAKLTVKDVELAGKKVLVRVDFNVPIKDGVITNDNRITAALPTIKYILENNGRAILFSHLGRVKTEEDKAGKSLAPVAKALAEKLGQEVTFVPETRGEKLEAAVNALKDGEILLVENTRFEDIDGKKESKNDPELGKYWASLGDGIFVNDAFGTAHRAHASNVGISANVEKAVAGFLLENEIAYIQEAVETPERPFVAILGGSKVSDKIGVIENLLAKADKVIIGGGMAYTFLKAQGYEIGTSLVEDDKLELAKGLLEKADGKLVLPLDHKVANAFADYTEVKETADQNIPAGFMGLDVATKTIADYSTQLEGAKTVVWNGPVGVFENPDFQAGTIGLMEAIVKQPGVKSIIGGGDSAAAAINLGYADKFSWISTGGGASMELLEGKVLPGLAALTDK